MTLHTPEYRRPGVPRCLAEVQHEDPQNLRPLPAIHYCMLEIGHRGPHLVKKP